MSTSTFANIKYIILAKVVTIIIVIIDTYFIVFFPFKDCYKDILTGINNILL